MIGLITIYLFLGVFAALATITLLLLKRQKRRLQLRPPEEFVLLRSPGETLEKQEDDLAESLMDWLL
ncbi:MAG TPA: hypothetical protein VD994_10425, partial [Prosthecobacter sp.]|nr:hypothetical protein [Prosthecobacter sp.]